jgi:hypothetical protein
VLGGPQICSCYKTTGIFTEQRNALYRVESLAPNCTDCAPYTGDSGAIRVRTRLCIMSRTESLPASPLSTNTAPNGHRNIPILPSITSARTPKMAPQPDQMDITTPPSTTARMGPPANSSPEIDQEAQNKRNGSTGNIVPLNDGPSSTNGASGNTLSAAAAATGQGPKVVQTAFIHKLYKYVSRDVRVGEADST